MLDELKVYTAEPPSGAPASHGVAWARSLHPCGGIPMAEAKAWQKADGLG